MTESDVCYLQASEIAAQIRAGALSPIDVVESVIARIEAVEPRVNAFSTLMLEEARAAAGSLAQRIAHDETVGPLAGVPVTIKDLTEMAGVATKRGSFVTADDVAAEDAPVVTRLKQADAIILGKTTTPEFGWKGVSQSPLTGITSNPWREGYNAGASSAGAAVAAATGMGTLHQGSDGAGSIRMPSHFSGVFGLKPTFGRVPNVPVPNNDWGSHVGPMTRTVADAALMLQVMAGPHPRDHTTLEGTPDAYGELLTTSLEHTRIGFCPDLGHARVDFSVASLVRAAVGVFEDLGCDIDEVSPDWGPKGPEIGRFLWSVHETPLARHFDQWAEQMDPGLIACIKDGQGFSAEEYLAMRARKIQYVQAVHRTFDDFDLLLTPAVSVAAFPADRLQPEHWPEHPWDWLSWAEFSYPFNLSGNPAASIPCGFTDDGLPVGLQIVGPRFADLAVLQAAHAYETATDWVRRPPLS